MLALLGSHALNFYQLVRTPVDTDLLGTYEDIQTYIKQLAKREKIVCNYPIDSGKKILVKTDKGIYEFEVAWTDSDSEALLDIINRTCNETVKDAFGQEFVLPHLNVLYMLKMSHRYRKDSPHFLKTMRDIQLMRKLGAVISHPDWLKWREKETYLNKLPKLNVKKDNFFSGDGIVYEWCHDSLHEAIAYLDKPAYLHYAGGEVWSDMEKFKAQPERIKLLGVLEEACVLAAERSQLCFDPAPTPRWSFGMALSKVCTSITSGYFREYSWENHDKVIAMYEDFGHNYMDKVRAGIASGIVKKVGK